jgi:murein DD-endopeptidase MepM/ murein hydrolase activator NlpD
LRSKGTSVRIRRLLAATALLAALAPATAAAQVPEATSGFQAPFTNDHYGYIFQEYASYPGGWVYHPGVDFNGVGAGDADLGLAVAAVADGIVRYADTSNWGGIVVEHLWQGTTWYSCYGHVQNALVGVGASVVKGQQICEVGKVGTSSAHLHWEMRKAGHPNPTKGDYWVYGASGLGSSAFVAAYYEDPEAFVAAHGAYSANTTPSGAEDLVHGSLDALGGASGYYYRYAPQQGTWNLFGVSALGAAEDRNGSAYEDAAFTRLLDASQSGPGLVDFLAFDGAQHPLASLLYLHAHGGSAPGVVATSHAIDAYSTFPFSFPYQGTGSRDGLIRGWAVYLTAGAGYRFDITRLGDEDFGWALLAPSGDPAKGYATNRAAAAAAGGLFLHDAFGAQDSQSVTAAATGWHLLVLWNNRWSGGTSTAGARLEGTLTSSGGTGGGGGGGGGGCDLAEGAPASAAGLLWVALLLLGLWRGRAL